MLKITVQLANGDQIDFTTTHAMGEWTINGETPIFSDDVQVALDNLYSYADAMSSA